MIDTLIRKARQVMADPTLRRWLILRAMGRTAGEPSFAAHLPPYLDELLPLPAESTTSSFSELREGPPGAPIALPLPGMSLRIEPGEEDSAFRQPLADIETRLALHRFAWLPLLGEDVDPAWVNGLWRAWRKAFGTPFDDWAWHPYTAAERAVNILDFGRRQGLPGPLDDTIAGLAAHAPAIAERLEYFGDHHTSNHLANNGRGLYLLALALGMERSAEVGARILVEEARRVFSASGMLREGSSHYHLLLARAYVNAWLAARAHNRPETPVLEYEARKVLAVIPPLILPGGLPLVGDVSPDCPPPFLMGLAAGTDARHGWTGLLEETDRDALVALRDACQPVAAADLAADGWLRADFGPWSGLWHAAPDGWSQMPGHGHQDCGAFEVHYADKPLFRDLGRGAYGEDGDAALYRSAAIHNTLTVDGADPYPPNKPYYDPAFRLRMGGVPPRLERDQHGVTLEHHGFARLGEGGRVRRHWSFSPSGLRIADSVEGRGRHTVTRRLHTTHSVETMTGGVLIHTPDHTFRLEAEGAVSVAPATFWPAYGSGEPATAIGIEVNGDLPWNGELAVEVS